MADTVNNDARTAESLIRDLQRMRDVPCAGCGQPVTPQEVLLSLAIGFQASPRCLPCLGAALEEEPAGLRDYLFGYIRQRECFLSAWNWANHAAGLADGVMPPNLQTLRPASDAERKN